jgi:hypothetical protein
MSVSYAQIVRDADWTELSGGGHNSVGTKKDLVDAIIGPIWHGAELIAIIKCAISQGVIRH